MKWKARIFSIKGIDIKIHISFLLIMALFSVFLSLSTFEPIGLTIGFGDLDIPVLNRWVSGTVTAVFIFSFLFLHELGHSLISVREGYGVKEITFFMLGGASVGEEFPEDPVTEMKIAAVGPAISVGIGSIFLVIQWFLEMVTDVTSGPALYLNVFVASIGFYNLIIGFFNLLPAFPLDGGRILRAVLGFFMDHYNATLRATQVAKVMAVIMGIVGILIFNLLLILIAVFIFMGAKNEGDMTRSVHYLKGLKVSDLMSKPPGKVAPDSTLDEVKMKMITKRTNVLLVKENGRVVGMVSVDDLRTVSGPDRKATRAGDVMDPDFVRAAPDEEASEAWSRMVKKGKKRILVLENGKVKGQVTMVNFRNALEVQQA